MQVYRALLPQEFEEPLDYYVVANDVAEAAEIMSLALQRAPHYRDEFVTPTKVRYMGLSLPPENISNEYGTGYFKTKAVRDDTHPNMVYAEIVMPFHEFSVRQYYVDIALEDLDEHK